MELVRITKLKKREIRKDIKTVTNFADIVIFLSNGRANVVLVTLLN